MDLTLDQLNQMVQNNNLSDWYDSLSNFLDDYEINTPQRVAAFIAQTQHESNNFKSVVENLYYRAESLRRVWPREFPTDEIANQYAMHPEMIANRAYANRMGNGDEQSGDGWRFCGRGLIQITGKENYQQFADSIGKSLDDTSSYMETKDGCVESACWFWKKHNLNECADNGDIERMTRIINGGTLGLEDRLNHYNNNLQILS